MAGSLVPPNPGEDDRCEVPFCPGGCGAVDACGCYAQGYSDGKAETYDELRYHVTNHHEIWACGCEPCITIRYVVNSLAGQLALRRALELSR